MKSPAWASGFSLGVKSSRRRNQFAKIAIAIVCLLAPSALPAAAKIRLSQSNVGVTAAPLWIATSQGLFKKYGVEVEPVYVRNSTIQMMALTTNEVQLSHTGGAPTLERRRRGT